MNTFNVTYRNSAKAVAIFSIIVIAIALIAGCGDSDNPTGGNNNPPVTGTEIIAFDTLLVRGHMGRLDSLHSSVLTKSVKIDFTVETNAVFGDNPDIGFKYEYWQTVTGTLPGAHSFTVARDSSKSTDVLIQSFMSGSDTSKYLRIINAKVYKVN